ncbi:type II secretion system protein GspM [Ottowia sp.]|uniref:type II secretion system protein GspM n=1 Tax=Ottowia sp. TaxID=1898956 RepID=UPI003A896756
MTGRTLRQRPEVLWIGLVAAALLVAAVWAGGFAWAKYQQARERLADIEPRHARLAGLLQNQELLTQAESAVKTNLTEYVYAATEDANQTGNTALQQVRDMATKHGLRVTSSQVTPPREEQGFDRIGLNLRVEGEWPQLVALLGDLARQRPLVQYGNLQIGSVYSGAQTGQKVFGFFDLYVLKERRP